MDTSLDALSELRSRMRAWVNENPREWAGGMDMNINKMTNQVRSPTHSLTLSADNPCYIRQNSLEIIVAFAHKQNWQDWGGRWNRRTKLMRQMKLVLDDLGVTYKLPLQPVQLQVRGGPSPFGTKQRRGSNDTAGTADNGFKMSIDPRFLSPEALGNAGGRTGTSLETLRRTDASG